MFASVSAAIGFSDHSGWAVIAVVSDARELVARRRIQTCPATLPRQVFHAVAEQGAPRSTVLEVMKAAVEMCAEAIQAATREFAPIVVAGVAMGRTAVPKELDKVLASHTLLHAAEGELYRDALSEAAEREGLRVVRFVNKEVRSEAAAAQGWKLEQLEARLAEIGRVAGKPWTKDEKDATAAAMLALAVTSARQRA